MLLLSAFALTPSCRPTHGDGRELTLDEIASLYLPPDQRDIDLHSKKKGQTGGGADKYSGGHNYLGFYQRELADRPPTSNLLELGINRGDSLIMWATHFCAGEVFGVGALHHAHLRHAHARATTPRSPKLTGRIGRAPAPEPFPDTRSAEHRPANTPSRTQPAIDLMRAAHPRRRRTCADILPVPWAAHAARLKARVPTSVNTARVTTLQVDIQP